MSVARHAGQILGNTIVISVEKKLRRTLAGGVIVAAWSALILSLVFFVITPNLPTEEKAIGINLITCGIGTFIAGVGVAYASWCALRRRKGTKAISTVLIALMVVYGVAVYSTMLASLLAERTTETLPFAVASAIVAMLLFLVLVRARRVFLGWLVERDTL